MAMIMDDPLFNETNVTSSFSESDSLILIVSLSITYGFIFVAGILGNISTCVVIRRNRSMHTATNFYLFSLAISDLLLLIFGLPLEVYRLWKPASYPLEDKLCITVGLISETSANATVLTITAFTVERYIAICRPFVSHKMSKLSRAVKCIMVIWACALCFAVPQVMQYGIETYEVNGLVVSVCTVKGHGIHQLFVTSSFLFFVIPMSLIIVFYILIGVKLHTSRVLNPLNNPSAENEDQSGNILRYRKGASQRKVIRMLVAVALSFFLCWAPFHVQRLIAIYGKNLENPTDTFYEVLSVDNTVYCSYPWYHSLNMAYQPTISSDHGRSSICCHCNNAYTVLTHLSAVLYFLSTSINPFLYSIMSNKFRNAFKVTFSLWCTRRNRAHLERTYSDLLAARMERAAAREPRRPHYPWRQRRSTTASSQLYDAPSRPQSRNQCNLSIVNEKSESRLWRQQFAERSDTLTSPQSISNSSLREVDQELIGDELATYLYEVKCRIKRQTGETSV